MNRNNAYDNLYHKSYEISNNPFNKLNHAWNNSLKLFYNTSRI
jgi:hypothetical protein